MDAHPSPDLEAALAELTSLGMRAVRVVTITMEAEQAAIDLVAAALPSNSDPASSMQDAIAAGLDIDSVAAALAAAVPRLEILARAHDRLSRSVRRTIALRRRLQTGGARSFFSDTRAAMQKRQVTNAVAEKIRTESDDEPAENLFAELDEQLNDPTLDDELQAHSVEEVVARICCDIGLAAQACAPILHPNDRAHPPDTG